MVYSTQSTHSKHKANSDNFIGNTQSNSMANTTTNTKALSIMEQWLQVLLLSYQTAPEVQIVKYINYYLCRILSHEECQATKQKHCQYLRMQKYWQWHLQQSR